MALSELPKNVTHPEGFVSWGLQGSVPRRAAVYAARCARSRKKIWRTECTAGRGRRTVTILWCNGRLEKCPRARRCRKKLCRAFSRDVERSRSNFEYISREISSYDSVLLCTKYDRGTFVHEDMPPVVCRPCKRRSNAEQTKKGKIAYSKREKGETLTINPEKIIFPNRL